MRLFKKFMENTRTYGTPSEIRRKFGSWTTFCLERPEDAKDIYNQLRIVDLGKAFVECYAGSKKAVYADMAQSISRTMTLVSKLKGSEKDRKTGLCQERFCKASDFRSMDEMINEGDEDGLKFEAYMLGHEDQIPFGNVQRNYPDSLQDGNPTSFLIGQAVYDMKVKGDFENDSEEKY